MLKTIVTIKASQNYVRIVWKLSVANSLSTLQRLNAAILSALNKKDGGLRHIGIGITFRRLRAKLACKSIRAPIRGYMRPPQFGFAAIPPCLLFLLKCTCK